MSHNPIKHFIRESVNITLNEAGLRHWTRAVNVLKKRGKTNTPEYKKAKEKLKAAQDSHEERLNNLIGRAERSEERRRER
jgi:hypothetical protein